MATGSPLASISVEQYLLGERDGLARHEYVAGQVYAMTGGSIYHNRIAGNFFAELKVRTARLGCDVFIADMKVQTARAFYYPDVMVVCDATDSDLYTKSRPVLIVEVISPNTQTIDEREKRVAYEGLTSLREYVLAEQDRAVVRVLRRTDDGWVQEVLGADDVIRLDSLGIIIAMQAIYEGVWR
jgi:Uma2 family endonuclease